MRIFKFVVAVFILTTLACSWSVRQGNTQDYYQEDPNKKILKQAVVGAGVGAVASGASGGSAGKGALIGAGTNVIGNALVDTLTNSPPPPPPPAPAPQVQYVDRAPESYPMQSAPRRGGCGR